MSTSISRSGPPSGNGPGPGGVRLPWRGALLAVLALAAAVSAYVGGRAALTGSQDFIWDISRALLLRTDPYRAYAEWLASPGQPRPFLAPTIEPNYFPSTLPFVWPVAALPWLWAKASWALLNGVLTGVVAYVLGRRYLRSDPFAIAGVALLLLASTPARTTIGNAQASLFAFAALLLAVEAGAARPALASVLLAASWIKYPLTFPLTLMFLTRERWRIPVFAGLIHLGLLAFLAWWLPRGIVDLAMAPLPFMGKLQASGFVDLYAVATRFGLPAAVPTVGSACLVAIGLVTAWRALGRDELLGFSLLGLLSCLWIYHRVYDLVVLVVPAVYVVRYLQTRGSATSWLETAYAGLIAAALAATWFGLTASTERIIEARLGAGWVDPAYALAAVAIYGAVVAGFALVLASREPAALRPAAARA